MERDFRAEEAGHDDGKLTDNTAWHWLLDRNDGCTRGAPRLTPSFTVHAKVGNLAGPSGTLWRHAPRTFSESRGTDIYLVLSCHIGKQNIVYQPRRAEHCDSSGLVSPGGGTGRGFIRGVYLDGNRCTRYSREERRLSRAIRAIWWIFQLFGSSIIVYRYVLAWLMLALSELPREISLDPRSRPAAIFIDPEWFKRENIHRTSNSQDSWIKVCGDIYGDTLIFTVWKEDGNL